MASKSKSKSSLFPANYSPHTVLKERTHKKARYLAEKCMTQLGSGSGKARIVLFTHRTLQTRRKVTFRAAKIVISKLNMKGFIAKMELENASRDCLGIARKYTRVLYVTPDTKRRYSR